MLIGLHQQLSKIHNPPWLSLSLSLDFLPPVSPGSSAHNLGFIIQLLSFLHQTNFFTIQHLSPTTSMISITLHTLWTCTLLSGLLQLPLLLPPTNSAFNLIKILYPEPLITFLITHPLHSHSNHYMTQCWTVYFSIKLYPQHRIFYTVLCFLICAASLSLNRLATHTQAAVFVMLFHSTLPG